MTSSGMAGAPRVVLVLVACCLALGNAGTAQAHAHYDHSQPAIGQVLATAPQRVDIWTDSEMRKASGANMIAVTSADGSRVDDGNTVLDDSNRLHFSVALQPSLPNGRYIVSFQTLSDADGDTDHGRFAFYVGAGPTAEQKQLDAALNGVVATPDAPAAAPEVGGPRSTPAIVLAAIVPVVLALLAGAGLLWRQRAATGKR